MARILHLKRKDAVIEVKYNTKKKVKGKGFVTKEIVNKRDVAIPSWPEFVNYILHTSYTNDVNIFRPEAIQAMSQLYWHLVIAGSSLG